MEFSLHTYLQHLRHEGASRDFIDAVHRNAAPLATRNLPILLTLGQLAYIAEMPYRDLLHIIERQIDPYRVFAIRKRRGGRRFICVPEPQLLSVQRWIHEHILCSLHSLCSLSEHATAFRPGSSHIANARKHLSAPCILKLDITRFFESISERQVYRIFRGFGYRAQVAFGLARLCTRVLPRSEDHRWRRKTKRWQTGEYRKFLSSHVVGHLPQGAPTSPMLANLVCRMLDVELQKIADREGLIYTRYADDMTFSGVINNRVAATMIINEISKIVGKYGFGINSQKTNIVKNGGRKIVTGLSVEDGVVRLPRFYKDKIRQELYFINSYGLKDHCSRIGQKNHLSYLMRLVGRIRYATLIEPDIGTNLMVKFEELFPDFCQLNEILAVEAE
jgi:RNA-directed DNA polymerase